MDREPMGDNPADVVSSGSAGPAVRLNKDGTPDKRYTAGRARAGEKSAGKRAGAGAGTRDAQRRVGSGGGHSANAQKRTGGGSGESDSRHAGKLRSRLRDSASIAGEPGDSAGSGAGPGGPDAGAGNAGPQAGDMGRTANANINPPGKARGGVRGTFTPQAAERLTVGVFGLVATVRRRPWWAIQNPAAEVRPWASDLAEVLNTLSEYLPLPYVQAGAVFGSGVAVAVGLAMLVLPRMEIDAAANAERRAREAAPAPTGRMPERGPAPQPEPAAPAAPPRHTGGAQPRPANVAGIFSDNGIAA